MARGTFGGSVADFAFDIYDEGENRFVVIPEPTDVTFWSAHTGGVQYTDLLVNGFPATSVETNAIGQVPAFQGPNNITELWADAGSERVLMRIGPVGPQGAAGRTVLNGTTVPSNALGVNGDFYLRTSTSTMYGPKADGTWPDGVSLVGEAGNSVLNGAGSPSNALGRNGDFYIDTVARIWYGPKAAGAWGSGSPQAYPFRIASAGAAIDPNTLGTNEVLGEYS